MRSSSGLDVSKGESQVQAFLEKGKTYRKSFSIKHSLDGLESLLIFLKNESPDGKKPSVILESTGAYISEIGEIDRFNHPKRLVAFAGVDPSVYSSGRFTATKNRITKRGSSRFRHSLFMAVQCGIRDARKKKTTDEIIP
ncbi:hypothetical protein J1TS3_27480 [Siminovitchia fordii]|uniref:Transposase IS116/IS110/IS902 C-terminal domain-containing protein n=1 Tax=Siminovitchia fordii TaxID=254759 RepID=A0ABQ4K7A1_9BACI|nr:hypothetical protein J1TS3_27480 [Siminovitchia fordii]